MIDAGGNISDEINENLKSSDVFISLISADYIGSDYCYKRELNTALQYHKEKKLIILPVIVRPCDWKDSPLGKLKALPNDGKAISTYDNQDEAYAEIVGAIRNLAYKNA